MHKGGQSDTDAWATLAPLDVEEQTLYSKSLLGNRAPHPISKGVPLPPSGGNSSAACTQDCSFSHDPKFMAIGEGRNVDCPVNQSFFPMQDWHDDEYLRPLRRIACYIASLMNMTPRNFPATWGRASHLFASQEQWSQI